MVSEERGEFSWGRGILHWLAAGALITAVLTVVRVSHGIGDPNQFARATGELFGKLLLPALGISYLFQTGRRGAALSVIGVIVALGVVGFVRGRRPPPVAELEKDFMQGCASKCPAGTSAEYCTALCSCVWDGILTAHPGDGAVAKFLVSASADKSELKRVMTDMAVACAARRPAL